MRIKFSLLFIVTFIAFDLVFSQLHLHTIDDSGFNRLWNHLCEAGPGRT